MKKKYHVVQIAHNVPSSPDGPYASAREGFTTLDKAEQYVEDRSRSRRVKRTRCDNYENPRWYFSKRGNDLAYAYQCTCKQTYGCECSGND